MTLDASTINFCTQEETPCAKLAAVEITVVLRRSPEEAFSEANFRFQAITERLALTLEEDLQDEFRHRSSAISEIFGVLPGDNDPLYFYMALFRAYTEIDKKPDIANSIILAESLPNLSQGEQIVSKTINDYRNAVISVSPMATNQVETFRNALIADLDDQVALDSISNEAWAGLEFISASRCLDLGIITPKEFDLINKIGIEVCVARRGCTILTRIPFETLDEDVETGNLTKFSISSEGIPTITIGYFINELAKLYVFLETHDINDENNYAELEQILQNAQIPLIFFTYGVAPLREDRFTVSESVNARAFWVKLQTLMHDTFMYLTSSTFYKYLEVTLEKITGVDDRNKRQATKMWFPPELKGIEVLGSFGGAKPASSVLRAILREKDFEQLVIETLHSLGCDELSTGVWDEEQFPQYARARDLSQYLFSIIKLRPDTFFEPNGLAEAIYRKANALPDIVRQTIVLEEPDFDKVAQRLTESRPEGIEVFALTDLIEEESKAVSRRVITIDEIRLLLRQSPKFAMQLAEILDRSTGDRNLQSIFGGLFYRRRIPNTEIYDPKDIKVEKDINFELLILPKLFWWFMVNSRRHYNA